MIKKEELLKIQRETGLPLSTLEKDYVLSLMIWSISQNQHLKDNWIFKGGTCLKKCYFGHYRFSEDLDYTVLPEASIDLDHVREQLLICFDGIFERFAVRISHENLSLSPFSDKQGLFIQVRIPYHGPLRTSGSLPKIKLDISQEEILVLDPIELPLQHHYSDKELCATPVRCYALYEIFAEKIRALVQRTRPRDLYDVIHLRELFHKQPFDSKAFREIAAKKFEHKGLKYPDALQNIPEQAFIEAEADWDIMLKHQVQNLIKIDGYREKLYRIIQWMMEFH